MTPIKREIRDIGFTMQEINTLERELIRNVERSDVDDKSKKRLCRIISNKLGYVRSVVRGQNFLEKSGAISVIRSEK